MVTSVYLDPHADSHSSIRFAEKMIKTDYLKIAKNNRIDSPRSAYSKQKLAKLGLT